MNCSLTLLAVVVLSMTTSQDSVINGLNPDAAMDFLPCLVSYFAIVNGGRTYDCGHAVHAECFSVFLELEHIECNVAHQLSGGTVVAMSRKVNSSSPTNQIQIAIQIHVSFMFVLS